MSMSCLPASRLKELFSRKQNPQSRATISQPRPPFSALPDDCKALIIDFLPAKDVENLRLISKDWGVICIRGLFNIVDHPRKYRNLASYVKKPDYIPDQMSHGVLSIRPQYFDMNRLLQISRRQWMAKHVRHVEIYPGDFHFDRFRQVLRDYQEEFAWLQTVDHLDPTGDVWSSNLNVPQRTGVDKSMDQNVDRIRANRHHCNFQILAEAFTNLPTVDCLHVTSHRNPFVSPSYPTHCTWRDMESFRIWHGDEKVAIDKYRKILVAASEYFRRPVRRLALDGIPLATFETADGQEPMIFKSLGVRELFIRFEWSEHCTPSASSGLVLFVNSFPHLQSLDFSGPKWDRSALLPQLFKNHFLQLKSLRLSDALTDYRLLSSFLFRHSTTLKHLAVTRDTLGGGAHWDSVQTALDSFRLNLKLEKFELQCERLEDESLIKRTYDENWDDVNSTFEADARTILCGGKASSITNARLLEMYLFGLCNWPMNGEIPKDWSEWGCWIRLPRYGDFA